MTNCIFENLYILVVQNLFTCTTSSNGLGELSEHLDGGFPGNASVGHRNTVLELFFVCWDALFTLVDVRLDHDTDDLVLSVSNLSGHLLRDLWLVSVVLVGVSVRAIDHHNASGRKLGLGLSNRGLVVIRSFLTSSQDDETVVVTLGGGDGSESVLGNTHEVVGRRSGLDSIDSHVQRTVSSILETNREGQTRSKLSVELRLGGPSTNSTK
ncbi:hypothetical protein OGAPHI_007381 [Ogataea philodendri]|uniref:Uncharacterized protein n=1 Tax=Ogataea philodendri TaxID=1378263 RepID=A0A9P8NVW2_9ASCO|nr:uncharacterized protein OGAPHI_007381 [Ogataea philodendri]KAH3660176.1 hypothetical protein OGAPHI_007381 [Ogataea philodendri]